MKFWCFHFEGAFTKESPEYPEQGMFSACLVPAEDYAAAEFSFLEALAERNINLIEIEEHFPVDTDPQEMDLEAPENLYWIEWGEETELAGKPTFEAFHLFPKEEVLKQTPSAAPNSH